MVGPDGVGQAPGAGDESQFTASGQRDRYVDLLRALSLLVVVLWHWAFTILIWTPDGPVATSPLGFTSGLWIFTWLLQVMPVFFYIGGYVHMMSWRRAKARGSGLGGFVWHRIRQLAVPGAALMLTWIVLGLVLGALFDIQWIGQAVLMVISPLWFLAVYLMLIALLPVALWLHRRFDVLALVWLGGLAMCVDVLRFRYGLEELGWLNMVLVWGLAHQAGFFYRRLVLASRRLDLSLLWAGLFALVGLVFSGLYPGSMVGVPGDRLSNMAPPTFVIVALLVFQMGVVETLRPRMEGVLEGVRWRRFNDVINRFALPLFLFHTTGMALWLVVSWGVFGVTVPEAIVPDAGWWVRRPLALVGPLLFTLPVIALFGKFWMRHRTERRPAVIPPRPPGPG
ncbi:acyltransferase family protein [Actinoalloteichus caeruleus]|uniref:Acyltransferase family protein n=1 Tax=Actinoalloteichus caeruleus DSM 43889 TaxID=1120930 RepID=A0ABT1JPS8_ACTCY|nr:acyltransferase [Actinoalloteichus caeruleus]MCP2334537.1 Acyltransferase family protein [Actinoalloteichus caeruleus DSM 43889]